MSLRWSVGASHEQGKRSNQEDSIFGEFDGENSVYPLIVLADGMGGHSDGEKASGLVTKTFFEIFRSRKGRADASFPQMLERAAREANDILRKAKEGHFPAWWKGKKDPIGSDAGCTLLAAHIDERAQEVYFLSVGDSLILLQTNGVWQWVNKRCLDTRLNQLLGKSRDDRHAVSDEEYEFQRTKSLKDPKAHGLTQAITGRREPNLVGHILGPFPLRAGDRLILASDGLEPFFVGDESKRDDRENFKDLERFLADIPVPRPTSEVVTMCRQSQATAKNIVQKVLNLHRPNQDNISVVLVEIPSDKAPVAAGSRPRRRHDTEPSLPGDEITIPRDSERGGISVAPPYSKEFGGGSFWKKVSCLLLLLVIILGGVIWNYRGVFSPPTGNSSKDGPSNRNVSNGTNPPIASEGEDNESQTKIKETLDKLKSLEQIAREAPFCLSLNPLPAPTSLPKGENDSYIQMLKDHEQAVRTALQEKVQSILDEQNKRFDKIKEEWLEDDNKDLIGSFKKEINTFKSVYNDNKIMSDQYGWQYVSEKLKNLKKSGENVHSTLLNNISNKIKEILDWDKQKGKTKLCLDSSSYLESKNGLKKALKNQLGYLKWQMDDWAEDFIRLCRCLENLDKKQFSTMEEELDSITRNITENGSDNLHDLFYLNLQLAFESNDEKLKNLREKLREKLKLWFTEVKAQYGCFSAITFSATTTEKEKMDKTREVKLIHLRLLELFKEDEIKTEIGKIF